MPYVHVHIDLTKTRLTQLEKIVQDMNFNGENILIHFD